ncbi:hypothetical protein EAF04_002571 [Stromatinia cepivora]|nr:hypothetical protein EAF04_002571 [Stromatinia cepivora]
MFRPTRSHFFTNELPLPSPCAVERIRQIEPDNNTELDYNICRSYRNNFLPRLGDGPKANFFSTLFGVQIIPNLKSNANLAPGNVMKRIQEAGIKGMVCITVDEAESENRKCASHPKIPSPPPYVEMDTLENDFRTAQNYTREHQIADLSWHDDFYPEPVMKDNDYFDLHPANATSHLQKYSASVGIDPTTPRKFTCFPKLPKELRLMVLKFAVFTPRAVAVRTMEFAPNEIKSRHFGPPRPPFRNKVEKVVRIVQTKTNSAAPILQVNQEFRYAALVFYDLCFGTLIYKDFDEQDGPQFAFVKRNSNYLVRDPTVHVNLATDNMYLENCRTENSLQHMTTRDEEIFFPLGSIRSIAIDLQTLDQGCVADWGGILTRYPNIEEMIFVARLNPSQLQRNNEIWTPGLSLARGTLELVDLKKQESLIYHERLVGDFYDYLWAHEFFDENGPTDNCPFTSNGLELLADGTWFPRIRVMGLLSNGNRI